RRAGNNHGLEATARHRPAGENSPRDPGRGGRQHFPDHPPSGRPVDPVDGRKRHGTGPALLGGAGGSGGSGLGIGPDRDHATRVRRLGPSVRGHLHRQYLRRRPLLALMLALRYRDRSAPQWTARKHNLIQIALTGLGLAAFGLLLASVPAGLLGAPDMLVTGNASHAGSLHWYLDRTGGR